MRRALLAQIACVGLDGVRGDAAALARPFGGLRDAVFLAEDVIRDLIEADGVRVDVLLVVDALGDHDVHRAEVECSIGVRQDGDPFEGLVADGRVVAERVDGHEFLAELFPVLEQAGEEHGRVVLRELPVACVEDEQIGVLGDVLDDVVVAVAVLRGRDQTAAAVEAGTPEMLGAPVPALDGVGRARLASVAAQKVHGGHVHAAACMQVFRLAMAVFADAQHTVGTVLVDDALDLGFHDIERFVPGNLDEFRFTAVCRVHGRRVAAWFPVDALERLHHAVLGIDALLVGERHVVGGRLVLGAEFLAVDLELPHGVGKLFVRILLVDVQGADSYDLPVFAVDCGGLTARAAARDALHRCGVDFLLAHPLSFLSHLFGLFCPWVLRRACWARRPLHSGYRARKKSRN